MRWSLPLVLPLLLAGCVFSNGPDQYGRYENCDAFAASGGYPIASGGDLGGNPNFLYLPGQDPIPLDRDYLSRQLEMMDALRDWCERNHHY
jgi:hypothetical protein